MPNESFQHTEPTHVYRTKHWRVALGAAIMLSGMTILFIFIFILWQSSHTFIGVPLWGFVVSNFYPIGASLNQAFRQKLVISPAGISITQWRTASTPWNNVVSLQIFAIGMMGINTPCLVLHTPPLGNQPSFKRGIPPELRGRVLPILFQTWERPAEIEQDLQQYISQRNDQANRGLFVPHSFAATPDPNEKRNAWLILGVGTAAIVTIATIVSVLF